MPRPIMFDCISSGQTRETIEMEQKSREHWFKHNKELIWDNAIGPIQGRIMGICCNKNELSRKLMDSQDEYFKFCRAAPPKAPEDNCTWLRIGPDPCDECEQDPTIPMRTPPPEQFNMIFEGLSKEGRGAFGYLQTRYNSGLPETRFCRPPTSNSEYAWKLQESVQRGGAACLPRRATIGSFYRARDGCTYCKNDYAPFHFP